MYSVDMTDNIKIFPTLVCVYLHYLWTCSYIYFIHYIIITFILVMCLSLRKVKNTWTSDIIISVKCRVNTQVRVVALLTWKLLRRSNKGFRAILMSLSHLTFSWAIMWYTYFYLRAVFISLYIVHIVRLFIGSYIVCDSVDYSPGPKNKQSCRLWW